MEANGETEEGRPPRDMELKEMGGLTPGERVEGTHPSRPCLASPPRRSSDPRLQHLTLPSLSPLPPAPPGPRPSLLLRAPGSQAKRVGRHLIRPTHL